MGKINLLKGGWIKSVGVTTGAKWKDMLIIKTKPDPMDPRTAAQVKIRTGFSISTSFFALFAPALRECNTLDTKSMSVRNALMKLNKNIITGGSTDQVFNKVRISKGTIPAPVVSDTTADSSTKKLTFNVMCSYSSLYLNKSSLVCVICHAPDDNMTTSVGDVTALATVTKDLTPGNIASTTPVPMSVDLPELAVSDKLYCWFYVFSKDGSVKRSSDSVYSNVTAV